MAFSDVEKQYIQFLGTKGLDPKDAMSRFSEKKNSGFFDQFDKKEQTKERERSKISQAATGAGKGLLSTASGISELGQKTVGYIPKKISSVINKKEMTPIAKLPESLTKPEGDIEEKAFAAEQVGEFFAPTPGGKIKAVQKGAKFVPKVLKFGQKAITEGLEAGTKAAMQTGEVGEEAKTAATFGAAAPAVIGAVTKPLKSIGKFTAGLSVPTTPLEYGKDFLRNIDVGKTIQENVGFALTKKGLIKKINKKSKPLTNKVNSLIDDYVNANPKESYTAKEILKNVEEEVMMDAQSLGLAPHQMNSIRPRIQQELSDIASEYKGNIDLKRVQEIKKELAVPKLYKGAVDKTLKAENKTILEAAGKFRKKVTDKIPEIKDLNKLLEPLIESKERISRKISNRSGLFYDLMIGSTYGLSDPSEAISNPANFLKKFGTAVIARRGLSSTAAKTGLASFTNNLDKLGQNKGFVQGLRKFYESSTGQNQQ